MTAMVGAIHSVTRAMDRSPPSSTGETSTRTITAPHHGFRPAAAPRAAVIALACTIGMARPLATMNRTAKTPPTTGRRRPRAM